MVNAIPFLWFDQELQDAVEFWSTVFPDTGMVESSAMPDGRTVTGTFRIMGTTYQGMNAGPGHPQTDAFSISVICEDQREVDRYWDALADHGRPIACGWIADRFGVHWQIVPKRMGELLSDPDPERAGRAMAAMMTMVKLDVAALEAAADGDAPVPLP